MTREQLLQEQADMITEMKAMIAINDALLAASNKILGCDRRESIERQNDSTRRS